MLPNRIRKFLQLLGTVPHGADSDPWINAPCPLAPWRHQSGKDSNPSFGVRNKQKPGVAPVKCFACGFVGTQFVLLYELHRYMKQAGHLAKTKIQLREAMELLEQDVVEAPLSLADAPDYEQAAAVVKPLVEFPEWWREAMPPAYGSAGVHPYLEQRGVGWAVAKKMDLRIDPDQQRLVVPVRDFAGDLRGLHGRAMLPEIMPVYRMYRTSEGNNPRVWLGEHWVDFEQPVIMVESVFDLASVLRLYPNVVAPLSASFAQVKFDGTHDPKILRMADALDVVLMFDGDDAGRNGARAIQQALPDTRFREVQLDEGEDPGGLTIDQLSAILDWLGITKQATN